MNPFMNKNNPAPGRYLNMPADTYHKIPLVSNSQRKQMVESPADWKLSISGEKDPTKAMEFGTLVHTAILTPHELEAMLAVGPNVNRNTKEWKEFAGENIGKILVKEEEFAPVRACRDAVLTHPIAKKFFEQGTPEVTYIWQEPTSKLNCKARVDWEDQENGILIDLKKVANGSSATEAFTRHVINYQYYVQAAFYLDAANAVMGKDAFNAFVFITVEEKPPHKVAVHRISDDFVENGRTEYQFDLQRFVNYFNTPEEERWDGLPLQINEMCPPAWFSKQREITEAA